MFKEMIGEAYLKDSKGKKLVSIWFYSRDLDKHHKEILDQMEAEYEEGFV